MRVVYPTLFFYSKYNFFSEVKLKNIKYILTALVLLAFVTQINAQSKGRTGFGIVLGEPTGGTLKHFTTRSEAMNFTLGNSYFGSVRAGFDYLWHFDAFRSDVVNMHIGPGVALGFGDGNGVFWDDDDGFYKRDDDGVGIAVRAVAGVNIYPRNTPLEIFFELAPFIGLSPDTGGALDVAVGLRVYP